MFSLDCMLILNVMIISSGIRYLIRKKKVHIMFLHTVHNIIVYVIHLITPTAYIKRSTVVLTASVICAYNMISYLNE